MCIEKISPKYYYHYTSLHAFCVYFANFDFVCVLCAKMQIRERGIKKIWPYDLSEITGIKLMLSCKLNLQFLILLVSLITLFPLTNYRAYFR